MHTIHCLRLGHRIPVRLDHVCLGRDAQIDPVV